MGTANRMRTRQLPRPARRVALLTSAVLAAAGIALIAPSSAATAATAATVKPAVKIVGGVSSCTTTKGALVAVGFARWSGPVVRGCDPHPTTGIKLLTTAKFTTVGDKRDGPGFICRIGNARFHRGTQYPRPAQDRCGVTPPATAYWSSWRALKGANTWTLNPLGAYSDKPKAGEVEAWVFGGTAKSGTAGRPTFTPHQIRTQKAAAKAVTSAARAATPQRAVAQTANLAKAVTYLTDPSNLVEGTHYESFGPGSVDFGLTMDGAFALAATGTADSKLAAITDYVADHADDYTGIGTEFASGGSVGKEALLAEITGHDPKTFGGHDLIATLEDLVCTNATTAGCAGAGNYEYAQSVFSQALAIMAQVRAGDASGSASPVTFLEGLQATSGAFPSVIPGSDSDVDSTAMAAMALDLLANDSTAKAAVTKATAWIATQQETDGGFPGAAGDSTNSAALAIQGLTLAGSKYRTQINDALSFLAGQQNSDGGFNVAADSQPGSDVRATTQVVGGIIGIPFGTLTDDVTAPAADVDPAAAADYLVKQLVDGNHLEYAGGFGPNYGGTADTAIALVATGTHSATLVALVQYLEKHVADYADPDGTSQFPGPYTGAAAKLALVAEITGQDPTDFGGFDLLKVLTDNVCTAADQAGTCTAAGDFYQAFSTVSQSLGVLALARGDVTPPASTVTRLEQLQCSDGGFSSTLIAPDATCVSDVDSTGFAVQALTLVPGADDVVAHAVKFLRAGQLQNGGWTGASGESSNSTALAIQALLAAPTTADFPTSASPSPTITATLRGPKATRSDPAVKAALDFLATLQNSDGGFSIATTAAGSDVAATAQVVPAIEFATLTSLHRAVGLPTAPGSGLTSSGGGSASPPGSGGSSGNAGGGNGSATPTSPALANTGAQTADLVGYALLLLLLGTALTLAGYRSRRFFPVARHAGTHVAKNGSRVR
jgi:prenyltransferase beta subunit